LVRMVVLVLENQTTQAQHLHDPMSLFSQGEQPAHMYCLSI